MKPNLASLFPNASASTVAANPDFVVHLATTEAKNAIARRTGTRNGKRGVMNKTEAEFALTLEAQKRAGEILRYEYEGITLRWADMRYTPDFIVFEKDYHSPIKLIEVKGGHIWDRDIVRYKGARAYWPEFAFEMWQLKKGQVWKRKY